ncbi:MAG: hypothetical protein AAGB25_02595 [Pseudomonadota bacterium]
MSPALWLTATGLNQVEITRRFGEAWVAARRQSEKYAIFRH